jgi:hypothetical protein
MKIMKSINGLRILLILVAVILIFVGARWFWLGSGPSPSVVYDKKFCNSGGAHSDFLRGTEGYFKSYNHQRNFITYTSNGEIKSDGWCREPFVEDAVGNRISIDELKPGDTIEITSDYQGIASIRLK